MTNRETMELFIEKNGQETVAYPFVEKDHVVFGNGMGIEEVIEQDISMPTVTHEEVSFKVGVGDQDVSSSVVDSSVGEMVIKGQTYHNILPEPSTHVLTNNKEMFKVNEGLDPNVEIVDGVAKSAILKGQTLVNLAPNSKVIFQKAWALAGSVGSLRSQNNRCCMEVDVKPNTIYTIYSNSETYIRESKEDYTVTKSTDVFTNGVRLITTLSETTKLLISFRKDSADTIYTEIEESYGNVVIEGDYTNVDIPYFEGMQSVRMPVLTTTGKNLLNNNSLIKGKTIANTTVGLNINDLNTNPRRAVFSESVKLDIGEKYFLKSFNSDYQIFTPLHDENGIITQGSSWKNEYVRFIAISQYMRIIVKRVDENEITDEDILKIKNNIMVCKSDDVEEYEPYKSNILSTPSDLELRGIGDVKDTLDCLTGEIVSNFSTYSFSDVDNWKTNTEANCQRFSLDISPSPIGSDYSNEVCVVSDKLLGIKWDKSWKTVNTITCSNGSIRVQLPLGTTIEQCKELMRGSKIVYRIKSSIKTVDLSSSGNWEKVVLDGKSSEDWKQNSHSGNFVEFEGYSNFCLYSMNLPVSNRGLLCDKLSYYGYDSKFRHTKVEGISDGGGYRLIFVRVKTEKLPTNDVAGFKQWLSQNPIEVSYMLSSNKNSTQVKQPIFFKDGHIIQSSGADNSLIPTLDYQAKTSNSYVMDLMKTNTKYTMKAKSASGTFTIDGTSYGAGTNGTFTTPSSMTNKFLVMSNNANEEVMIIEGDVVSKTIPYFKGIKSAFEDESQIEVLSTGKNLFDGEMQLGAATSFSTGKHFNECFASGNLRCYSQPFEVGSAERVSIVLTNPNHKYAIYQWDNNKGYIVGTTWLNQSTSLVLRDNTTYISIYMANADDSIVNPLLFKDSLQVEVANSPTTYEPYKSNSTKIPLLSPLRSLPNGVCDELIIDQMKKKATLIQRVGKLIHHGQGGSVIVESKGEYHKYGFYGLITPKQNSYNFNSVLMCDTFMWNDDLPESQGEKISSYKHTTGTELRYVTSPNRTPLLTESCFRDWLSRNPVTVYYELETPVITEVDLEGFPYIYKDGHLFLNSEISPNTQITYSISQQHQISASTQDLIRHEQELVYLYKLIAQYIQVDYQSTLLSLDLKLK